MTENISYSPDTVTFEISCDHTVVNNTIKLIADVSGLVDTNSGEETIRNDIRLMMKKIVDADWQFANMQRNRDSSGYERFSVVASTRVSESENYNLDTRAKAVSKLGMTVTQIIADNSIPLSLLRDAHSVLRLLIIEEAKKEMEKIAASLNTVDYRIHHITFGEVNTLFSNYNAVSNVPKSYRASAAVRTLGGSEQEHLGNSTKIAMTAKIVISSPRRINS